MYEPAKNYTTKSAQPIMPQLSSLLTPIPKMSPSSSSTVITEMVHVAHTASSSTSTSSTSTVASTVNFSHTRKQQYQILLPPKLKKPTAEQLVLENEALHKLAIAAGAILDVNYAQMKLMDYKNEWLRQKAFVKKKQVALKPKLKGIKKRWQKKGRKLQQKQRSDRLRRMPEQWWLVKVKVELEVTCKVEAEAWTITPEPMISMPAQDHPQPRQPPVSPELTILLPDNRPFINASPEHHTSEDSASKKKQSSKQSKPKGYKWIGKGLQFEVLWDDGDVTWEKRSNIEDCAALDEFDSYKANILVKLDGFGVEIVDINAELLIQQLNIRGSAKLVLKFEYGEANTSMKGNSHGWPSAILAAISDPSLKYIHCGLISHQKNIGKDS
ncbi:hypothetical protein BT96DRAFT_945268 [Gymnopus androsaceus JB14]|uniref:Chromo domain-containing protein n=1 Tax=Gymnopus androsaceus JB14 TaxID=1447944 RepID=A0A6A4H2L8_9AGAR|nr:hypothetical protein BT96DRAFT_945268 [Gymnopus androsaceus JB14]